MKAYLVTFNGWRCGYGSNIYVVGIFDDLSKATEVIHNIISTTQLTKNEITVDVLEMNADHKVDIDTLGTFDYSDGSTDVSYKTDLCLGGYCE